jgi:hypothetical protein
MKYRVNLLKTISLVITVEAEDEVSALEAAYEEAPSGLCHQCGGWGQKWGVDDDGEWLTSEEFHGDAYDEELHGKTVVVD